MEKNRTSYRGTKAYLIARVSDPSQVQALPAQVTRLKDYGARLGLSDELYEFDETAYTEEKRRQFKDIVEKVANEKDFCIVVFDKIDRCTRDCSSDIVRTLKKLVKQGRIELHFPSDSLILSKDSPAGDKTRFEMGMVFGGYYSAAISDNVKRRQQQKILDGEYPGKVPFGYKNVVVDYNSRGDKITDVKVDIGRSEYVQRAYELRLEGLSVGTITKILNKEGATSNTKRPKPLNKTAVDAILKNKFYIGIMVWNGIEYPHKYEHLVSDTTFNAVQELNSVRSHQKLQTERKDGKDPFAYNGLRCAVCGGAMSSYVKKGHTYLRCSKRKEDCGNCNVAEAVIDEQISETLNRIRISSCALEKIADTINQRAGSQHERLVDQKKLVRKEAKRLKKQVDMAYEDRLNGSITVEQYNEIATKKEKRIKELEEALEHLEEQDNDVSVDASYLLELAQRLPELFENSRSGIRNEILQLIFSNLKIKQKKLQFTLLEPFNSLYQRANKRKWLPRPDSNWQPRS